MAHEEMKEQQKKGRRPRQTIFLMSDTTRPDMCGCYGNPRMHTPNIDRLAREGMRFQHAYTTQPVCGPARSAIFTGLYPHSNGVWANSLAPQSNVVSIGQRLQDQGIHTAYIGKWHLDGGDYFGLGTCPPGWDPEYWYDMRLYLEDLGDPRRRYWSRQYESSRNGGVKNEDTYACRCADRAVDFIERHRDEDFFLVVSFDEPHGPSLAPEPFASMYEGYAFPTRDNLGDPLTDKPVHQQVWAGGRQGEENRRKEVYAPSLLGSNSHMDQQLGRVLDAADQYLDTENLLTVFTSDHGDALEAHALSAKGPCVYDEIAAVPLIYRYPGRIEEGSVFEGPASHIDFVPTFLSFYGLPEAQWAEGLDIWPSLEDKEVKVREHAFIEFGRYEIDHDGFGGFQPMRAVYDGRYKLAIHLLSTDEMYDTLEDPSEMRNLIHDPEHQAKRDALHDVILRWMNETRDPFRGYYWERRPWRTDARPASWDYTRMTRQREHEPYEARQLDYSTGLPMAEATRVKDRSPEEMRHEAEEIIRNWPQQDR